jgi:carbonic anhydrase
LAIAERRDAAEAQLASSAAAMLAALRAARRAPLLRGAPPPAAAALSAAAAAPPTPPPPDAGAVARLRDEGRACRHASAADMAAVLRYNGEWAAAQAAADPAFFPELAAGQAPEWLWIGCSDSRVPATALLGMRPGAVFEARSVGNLATHKDLNAQAALEYAVAALKVKHVLVVGHYGCGAVKAALEMPVADATLVNLWIQDIREVRDAHATELAALKSDANPNAVWDALVRLNVRRQVFNVATSPVVQRAWAARQRLALHGAVYSLKDGLLETVTAPLTGRGDVEELAAAGGGAAPGATAALARELRAHLAFEQ